jgi:hypothetical protein
VLDLPERDLGTTPFGLHHELPAVPDGGGHPFDPFA